MHVPARDACAALPPLPLNRPAPRTSMMDPSALLGTTMKRRERGGVLSGSDGSSSCMGRGGSVVSVLHGRRHARRRREHGPAAACIQGPPAAANARRAAACSSTSAAAGSGAISRSPRRRLARWRGHLPRAKRLPTAPPAPHLVCGESASSTLSLGPWPSFRVTSCRFSIASAAEEARSNLT